MAEVEGGGVWDPRRHAEKMARLAKFMEEGIEESGGDDERHPFEGEEVMTPMLPCSLSISMTMAPARSY